MQQTYSLPSYAHSSACMPPIEPPTTAATWRTPRSFRSNRYRLGTQCLSAFFFLLLYVTSTSPNRIYRTSSRMVVEGKSAPYHLSAGFPFLAVTGLAVPYGLPRTFMQITKNLSVSKVCPGPRRGPHQLSMSALPERAWQTTITLSAREERVPNVMYATGTLCISTPESSIKEGWT